MGLPFITKENPMKANPQSGLIKSWSSTTLDNYLECPYRAFLKHVKRVLVELPEEEEKSKNAAMERGSDLHSTCEDFIQGVTDALPKKIKHCRDTIVQYREWLLTDPKSVHIEEKWAFDALWGEADWYSDKTWARVKLDAMHFSSETSARIDDWKSGKKFGNEGKHMRQLLVYAIAAFFRFPKLQLIKISMRYLDLATDNYLSRTITREEAMRYMLKIENQALGMTTATEFQPRPNQRNCVYCPFASRILGTDARYCDYAIVEL
jgi:hypothetical protein